MGADVIQANYEELESIASCFGRCAESNDEMASRVRQAVDKLRHGDWIGKGSEAFFREMEGEVLPAMDRLSHALEQSQQVTREIIFIIQQAEEEAAHPFNSQAEASTNTLQNNGSNPVPPPRVYIVSGINSAGDILAYDRNGNPIIGDDQSVALEQRLEQYGYDPDQVRSTSAIYLKPQGTNLTGTNLTGTNFGGLLSPLDWVTGGIASGVNTVTDIGANVVNTVTGGIAAVPGFSEVYGSVEVIQEHIDGERGKYTQQIYNEIAADLRDNPLAPGQSVILMGHSGGGAVAANLSGMLERNLGVDVSGMVTMGSPVSNYDEAGRYAEVIADVRHSKDLVVNLLPTIRSEESRINPIAALFNEESYQHTGATPNVASITLNQPTSDAHGSYMHDQNVSVDMLRQLKTLFPNMDLQLSGPSPT